MNSLSIKSLVLFTIFLTTGLCAAKKAPELQLIIKTVKNTTHYDISLVDRLAKNKKIVLPAGETVEVNFLINGKNEVILMGSMAEVMGKKAQYVFKKLDQGGNPEPDQEVYFNVYLSKGGVDNGSGIITGTPGAIALNFWAAGKNGGCIMSSGCLNNPASKRAEFDLELFMNDNDVKNNIFRLGVGGNLTEK